MSRYGSIKPIAVVLAGMISLLLAFQSHSIRQVTIVCKSYTITSSDGYSWSGSNCWEEYTETGSGGGGSSYPDGGGSGGSGDYSGTPTDQDGDNAIDCWKDTTETGDYVLDESDDFGPRTLNGVTKPHNGIDIAATHGTVIYSPAYGIVEEAVQLESLGGVNGAFVRVNFTRGGIRYQAVMIHMKENSIVVDVGDLVVPGQAIGQVNSTGSSTGNHLHLQIYEFIAQPSEPTMPGDKPTQPTYTANPIDPLSILGDESCQKQH